MGIILLIHFNSLQGPKGQKHGKMGTAGWRGALTSGDMKRALSQAPRLRAGVAVSLPPLLQLFTSCTKMAISRGPGSIKLSTPVSRFTTSSSQARMPALLPPRPSSNPRSPAEARKEKESGWRKDKKHKYVHDDQRRKRERISRLSEQLGRKEEGAYLSTTAALPLAWTPHDSKVGSKWSKGPAACDQPMPAPSPVSSTLAPIPSSARKR